MSFDVPRPGLYRASINLWVEDVLTREYLSALWNDPDIAFLIAGGNEGVRAVVHDAERAGFPGVFGLIDSDFRATNRLNWLDPHKTFRTFVLPVHEVENYLLDADALAACRFNNLSRTRDEIRDLMNQAVKRLCWCAACGRVVAGLRARFRQTFISNPSFPRVSDEPSARSYVCHSPWFRQLPAKVSRTTEPRIHRLLAASHQRATSQVANGVWSREFPGKEIFHDVCSRICDRKKFPNYNPSPAIFDVDVAKEIAASQFSGNRVPSDLVELRAALKERIARGP